MGGRLRACEGTAALKQAGVSIVLVQNRESPRRVKMLMPEAGGDLEIIGEYGGWWTLAVGDGVEGMGCKIAEGTRKGTI